jgi:two-component system sensor histidine kinase TctE
MSASLRGRLLWWLLLPLAVFVLVTGVSSYENARRMASLVEDNALLSSARMIAGDIGWDGSALRAPIPPAALEVFAPPAGEPQFSAGDQVFYHVVTHSGRTLSGTPGFAVPADLGTTPRFYDTTLDGRRIRAVAYVRQMYDSGATQAVTVLVGKTQASRAAMIHDVWRPQLMRQLSMLVLAIGLVYLGLTFELRPLIKLKDDIADRAPMQLEPLRITQLHAELRPIVDVINQCIARLTVHGTTQRKFIADAAHQLRTPLTLLATQIQFACQRLAETQASLGPDSGPGAGSSSSSNSGSNAAAHDSALAEALAAIRGSSERMIALTNQLLLLAQAEAAPSDLFQERVCMTTVVAGVLEELVLLAERRSIDLGAELDDDIFVTGNANLLSALVMNLVDNALRYTPRAGRVTVSVRAADGAGADQGADKGARRGPGNGGEVLLQVTDNGPGIAAEARSHVFERFYRASATGEGTGLGLSIVREIVQSHGGSISLAPGSQGRGLVVSVRLARLAG